MMAVDVLGGLLDIINLSGLTFTYGAEFAGLGTELPGMLYIKCCLLSAQTSRSLHR